MTNTPLLRFKATEGQWCAMQLDDGSLRRSYEIEYDEATDTFVGTAAALRELADTAAHLAGDWSATDWRDPMATSARALARKLTRLVRNHEARSAVTP